MDFYTDSQTVTIQARRGRLAVSTTVFAALTACFAVAAYSLSRDVVQNSDARTANYLVIILAFILALLVVSSVLLAVFVQSLLRPPSISLSRNGVKYSTSLGGHRSWSWADVEKPHIARSSGVAKIVLNSMDNDKAKGSLVISSAYPIRPEDLLELIQQKYLEASSSGATPNTIVTPVRSAKRPSLGWVADSIKPVTLSCCALFLAYEFTYGIKHRAQMEQVPVQTNASYVAPPGCSIVHFPRAILFGIPKACEAASQQVDLRRDRLSSPGRGHEWLRIGNDAVKVVCNLHADCIVHAVIRNKYILKIHKAI